MKILVTGGAGFIGSNFLNHFVPKYPNYTFINLDKLTYAANLNNLNGIEGSDNYFFEHADIADYDQVDMIFKKHQPDLVVNFAAESHVDRSIKGPAEFINTNILGTFNLLEASRKCWDGKENKLFHQVSTDEVYGSLKESGRFTEHTRYDPSSPYSASKASSDHLVRSYFRTYNLPVTITNCSNNYGPFQFPEKLIPLMILKALNKKPLPVYGKGENIRDWLYVEDHCEAIWQVINHGTRGETYNIGGNNEKRNIDVVTELCDVIADYRGESTDIYRELITFVKDRPGHDFRYAIDSEKITSEIGWEPNETFKSGLNKTVKWYLDNLDWLESVQTGEYIEWMKANYDI